MLRGGMRSRLPLPMRFKERLAGDPNLGRRTGFKFLHSAHTQSVLTRGSLKIGRLSEYRVHEKDAIRDQYDGTETLRHDHIDPITMSMVHKTSIFRQMFQVIGDAPEGKESTFKGGTFVGPSYDAYLYCFSYECSSMVLESFVDSSPYDAVLECTDIDSLAKIVVERHPNLKGHRYIYAPVIYRAQPLTALDARPHVIETIFEKDAQYKGNVEGRIVFVHPSGDLHRGELPPLDIWEHRPIARLFRSSQMPTKR